LYENQDKMLLKKYDITYEAAERGRMGVVSGTGKSRIETKYVIVKENNKKASIELNKKSVLQTFEDDSDVLESFAKKEKLSFRKEADVIKMLNYLSSSSS